jgi:hypothetical protein
MLSVPRSASALYTRAAFLPAYPPVRFMRRPCGFDQAAGFMTPSRGTSDPIIDAWTVLTQASLPGSMGAPFFNRAHGCP